MVICGMVMGALICMSVMLTPFVCHWLLGEDEGRAERALAS